MSDQSPIDLSELNFTPDWLKQPAEKPAARQGNRGRDGGRPGDRKGGKPRGGGRPDNRGGSGKGGRGRDGGGRGDRRHGQGRGRGKHDAKERRPAPPPAPEGISATLAPGDPGVRQIADQIKKTARAYPVFEVAQLVLASRERYTIEFKVAEGSPAELFSCSADGSLWLSQAEAKAHLPDTGVFAEYYEEESVEGDPPKGNFTSVAVCGMSGKLIAPPNHHLFQTEVARIHREKFGRMPIEKYKGRIRIEQDEEMIEKWKAEQSIRHHYTYKPSTEGDEPLKFESREGAGRHFIDNHADAFVSKVSGSKVPGDIAGKNLSPGLLTLLREVSDNAHRHPATLVQPLCGMLGAEGLKFFKRGRQIFAALTRPKPLNDDSGLSAPILAIVEFLRANKRANVETLLDALAPTSPQAPEPEPEPKPEPGADSGDEGESAPEASADQPTAPNSDKPQLTPAQIKVLQDLRWLLHEGAAIAFGDGHIELATPRPTKQTSPADGAAKKTPPPKEATPATPTAPVGDGDARTGDGDTPPAPPEADASTSGAEAPAAEDVPPEAATPTAEGETPPLETNSPPSGA